MPKHITTYAYDDYRPQGVMSGKVIPDERAQMCRDIAARKGDRTLHSPLLPGNASGNAHDNAPSNNQKKY